MPPKPRGPSTLFRPAFVCAKCRLRGRALLFRPSPRGFASSLPAAHASASSTGAAPSSRPTAEKSKYLQVTNRTVIRLAGPDAAIFLFNLVPAKILDTGSPNPIYTAFLSPHGRILNDVFIYPPAADRPEEWLVEVDSQSADELMKHLRKHKLRSKFKLEKLDRGEMSVHYKWPSSSSRETKVRGGQDPRPGMGTRWVRNGRDEDLDEDGEKVSLTDYTVHRMLNGVAEGQTEMPLGASLPQESNLDFLGGIDFTKGCYLGQELTIRTHHTGVVRKRILPCQIYHDQSENKQEKTTPEYDPNFDLEQQPPSQSNISKVNARGRAGRSTGKWLAGVGNIGLALCRLEMMTDIQLTADRTNYDPSEKYSVQWEVDAENEGTKHQVMLKPFVPVWLRQGVEQSLHRKDKKAKSRKQEEEDDYEEDVD